MSKFVLKNGDCLEVLKKLPDNSIHAVVTDPPAGIAFMGKSWDENKGGRDQWIAWLASVMRECNRVLKPGGHALVWALPRTSHWTAMALEDAGFEIRDSMHHIFGSGFPKSMDVSKAIDKAAGAEREILQARTMVQGGGTSLGIRVGERREVAANITAPATDAAKQWEGWGTALKPAHEVWWLARKPLEGTVAGNVQTHGTGALNIDGCRVSTATQDDYGRSAANSKGTIAAHAGLEGKAFRIRERDAEYAHAAGRWPPNLLLTHSETCVEGGDCAEDCPVAEMDRQSGMSKSPTTVTRGGKRDLKFAMGRQENVECYGDSGGASRFFPVFRYQAKPSKSDKGESNTHPTVKSTALMEWLIKLITPPNGIVLDPFLGSGTTGVSATRLGFRFFGIEQEPQYFEIAKTRIENELKKE